MFFHKQSTPGTATPYTAPQSVNRNSL